MLKHKTAWWQLYLLVPIMFGLMAVEHLKPLPGIPDPIFDATIMILTFGAMLGWVYLNRADLGSGAKAGPRSFKITVYEPATNTPSAEWDSDRLIPEMHAHPLTRLTTRQSPVRPGNKQHLLN